jgi:hypothetical protein
LVLPLRSHAILALTYSQIKSWCGGSEVRSVITCPAWLLRSRAVVSERDSPARRLLWPPFLERLVIVTTTTAVE